jgi:hypothetical protein
MLIVKKWNFEFNPNKTEIMVLQKGRKLKATDRWRMNGRNVEIQVI